MWIAFYCVHLFTRNIAIVNVLCAKIHILHEFTVSLPQLKHHFNNSVNCHLFEVASILWGNNRNVYCGVQLCDGWKKINCMKYFHPYNTFIGSFCFFSRWKKSLQITFNRNHLHEICALERLFIQFYFDNFFKRIYIFFRLHLIFFSSSLYCLGEKRFQEAKLFHDPIKFNQVHYYFYESFSKSNNLSLEQQHL